MPMLAQALLSHKTAKGSYMYMYTYAMYISCVCTIIDIIDYVTGIGNSSREQ